MYWNYFKYLIEHKKNVGIEAWKMGMYVHAFTHDLSKFLPSECKRYAYKFFKPDDCIYTQEYIDDNFEEAWLLHQHRNKHHWDYWVNSKGEPVPMPMKYVMQMIVDWRGMSRKMGDTPKEYFEANREKMILHQFTINKIEARI